MKKIIFSLIATIFFASNVKSQCNPTFTTSNTTCDSIWFISVETSSSAIFYWNFGDGATSTYSNPSHLFGANGTYGVTLTVSDTILGCSNISTQQIIINCPPSSCDAQFTQTYIACDSVWFVPFSTGLQYTYDWDFGDGATSTYSSPAHLYAANGTYVVTLTIADTVANCTNSYTYSISVNCAQTNCTVNGAFSTSVDSTNCDVYFISTAFGGTAPYTYYWDFGDGTNSSLANPTHYYPNGVTVTPCLTVTDANGCDTTFCNPITVQCSPSSCDAQFTQTYIACDSVWFVPFSTGLQYTYDWDFGDGATSTYSNPAHLYAANGTYVVTLTIADTVANCTNSYTYSISVNCAQTNCTVNGAFSTSVDSTNCDVYFISTAFGGTAPYTYYWDFGDGTNSSLANPTHYYPNGVTVTPCLTVTDANGCDTTFCNPITVQCSPSSCDAQFTQTYIACDSVWFVPFSTGLQYTYDWDFGDGATSTYSSPAHLYAANGTYLVTLTIADTVANCTNSYTYSISVNCGVTPCFITGGFSYAVDSLNCEVQFISTAYGGATPYTYYWDFGDGNTSSLTHPTNQYFGGPTFTTCLVITDSIGCDFSMCNPIYVQCAATGINEQGDNLSALIYPNPITDIVTIKAIMITEIILYDISGKMVLSISNQGNSDVISLNLSDLESGTYIILISTKEGLITDKLIKY